MQAQRGLWLRPRAALERCECSPPSLDLLEHPRDGLQVDGHHQVRQRLGFEVGKDLQAAQKFECSPQAVVRARNLAAYVPSEIPNPQLELIILLPQTG